MTHQRSRRRHLASTLWAVALTALAVTALPGPSATAVGRPAPLRPKVKVVPAAAATRWSSGVYPGKGINLAAANTFATYVRRPLDNVHVFLEASTWQTIGYETWEVQQYDGFPGQLVIDFPLLPSEQPDTLANVAAGKDDMYFSAMAKSLVALGRSDAVLVLGSEFNGDWQTYSAFQPAAYIAAYRHVAKLLKSISPDFVIDWTGNAIDNQSGHDPFRDEYPGDDVVDLVGVDAYDYADSAITDGLSFTRWASLPFGIDAWAQFARQHGKKFSLPEWGLSAADWGSGDVPAYITGMHTFMMRLGSALAFEDYFNQPAGRMRNSLNGPDQMPRSSARYRALWGKLPAGIARITPRTARAG